MVHRFQSFEICEETRELRAGGRVLPMQPRVFDLLVYLVRHRDRVVPKEELLDRLWPGVIVADGAVQRAVCLARTALARAGAEAAVRTFSRCGYRFCAEPSAPPAPVSEATRSPSAALARARAASSKGDWSAVDAAMRQVNDFREAEPADFQGWVQAVQNLGPTEANLQPMEHAVAGLRSQGCRRLAAWLAILLAQLRLERREDVLARGWQQRAERLLADEPDCRERGYLDLLGCRIAFLHDETEAALALAERARAAGERFNDSDLESVGLVCVGEANIFLGRVRAGLAALDEAGAAVAAGGLSAWAGGLVYCGVIYCCMTRADWRRAGQWTDQFTRWGADKGSRPTPDCARSIKRRCWPFAATCARRTSASAARGNCSRNSCPGRKAKPGGSGGEIHLAKGDFAAARKALARATELGWECQLELALVRHASGDAEGAANLLARAIADNAWSCRAKRGRALAHLGMASAEAVRLAEARQALDDLARDPELTGTPALQALAQRAQGELAAAEGRKTAATTLLRSALRGWHALDAPLPAAHTRCQLAVLLASMADLESAEIELKAAEAAFRQARATGWVKHCQHLRRRLRSLAKAA